MNSDEVIAARAELVRKKLGVEHCFDLFGALKDLTGIAKNFSLR